jgi:hypothetical protein
MVRFWIDSPFEMVISPSLQPINALVVANQGLPIMTGGPLVGSFEWMTRKSTGYSHEAKVTMISSKIPSSITLVLSANSKMVGVGLRRGFNCNFSKVVAVITLMVAPVSMRVFPMETSLMVMVTIGFPRFPYFASFDCFDMYSESYPIKCTLGGSFFFIPDFLIHNSLTTLLYIGISLMACSKGILTQIFFNSFKMSNSGRVVGFSINNLSR